MKMKVSWKPNFDQDFNAMVDPNSPFFDQEFYKDIIDQYDSIENFKLSEKYQEMKNDYENN